jgi:hypothetical protein
VHPVDQAPDKAVIAAEITALLPELTVTEGHRLSRSVKVCSPTLKNAALLDGVRHDIEGRFGDKPVWFTGMRTDTGVFFSHHTIGLAYETALDCSQRLS